jgi:hypothetical protein
MVGNAPVHGMDSNNANNDDNCALKRMVKDVVHEGGADCGHDDFDAGSTE